MTAPARGRWQQAIVGRLEHEPAFVLVDVERRPLSSSEGSAVHRAAKLLEARGVVACRLVWGQTTTGREQPLTYVLRPGVDPAELGLRPVPDRSAAVAHVQSVLARQAIATVEAAVTGQLQQSGAAR